MNSYSGNAYLSMFNENWDIVWQKTYDFPNNLGLGGLLVAPNSGYYISGRYYPYTNNKSDIILLKTDSLGNCTPKANFSLAQQDSLLTLSNTSFGADSYEWHLGNGTVLNDTNLQYIYPQTGIYNVCLVAHNLCGNDTLCQTINYGVADGVGNLSQNFMFSLLSNPISQPTLYLSHPPLPTALTATLYNLNGQALLQQSLPPAQANSRINVAHLPAGVYLLQIKGQNVWWQQKVVLVK